MEGLMSMPTLPSLPPLSSHSPGPSSMGRSAGSLSYLPHRSVKLPSSTVLARSIAMRESLCESRCKAEQRAEEALTLKRAQKARVWRQRMGTSPYGINLVAEGERIEEEQRVRQKMADRKARKEEREREAMRAKLVEQAWEEVRAEKAAHRQRLINSSAAKEARAREELARASAIGERMLSDPYVRVREPTDEVRAHRDAKWEERRQERRRDYEQRMAKIAAQREARRLAQERRKEERKLKGAASAGQLPLMPL